LLKKFVLGLAALGAIGVILLASGAFRTTGPAEQEARVEPNTFMAAPEPTPTLPPAPLFSTGGNAPAPTRELPHDAIIPIPLVKVPATGSTLAYAADDFLRDYLTNTTWPRIVDAVPWTNGTVNYQQYNQPLGGVTYWDFFSEHENWGSPSYLFQDDDGKWQPYLVEQIRGAQGQPFNAYILVDRKGPGAMEKIWFTQDAVWMLATEQSSRDVGPIASVDALAEWGNLEALGNFRIEVDDHVAFDGPIQDWFSGKMLGLGGTAASALTWRHREFGSSGTMVPVLYQRSLRVMVYGGTKKPKWFMATGVRFPNSVRVQPFPGGISRDDWSRLAANVLKPEAYVSTLDNVRVFDLVAAPNAPAVLRADGAGTFAAMQFTLSKKYDARQLYLRVRYAADAAINMPFLAFFSDHNTLALHRSTPIGVLESPDAYVFYSNLPMPFRNGISVEISTRGTEPISLTAGVAVSSAQSSTELRSFYGAEEKLQMYGPDYQVKLAGDGKLVGLTLVTEDQGLDAIPKIFAKPNEEDPVKRAWSMGYLEGNLSLFDGVGNSRLYGGHEDWADGGFYFNRGYTEPAGGANRPFGGLLRYKNGKDGYATIFRYFNDLTAFAFKNGLTMNFGHGTWQNNFPVKYGVTVLYYSQK
jgi:hypothetical protein